MGHLHSSALQQYRNKFRSDALLALWYKIYASLSPCKMAYRSARNYRKIFAILVAELLWMIHLGMAKKSLSGYTGYPADNNYRLVNFTSKKISVKKFQLKISSILLMNILK